MKERPILFKAEMVNAILDGRKTQTRRVIKFPDDYDLDHSAMERMVKAKDASLLSACKFGKVGDQLWVRETTEIDEATHNLVSLAKYSADGEPVLYSGSKYPEFHGSVRHWDYSRNVRPSIHMKRDYSRIQLEITDIRVERLNDISDKDAVSEGILPHEEATPFFRDYSKQPDKVQNWFLDPTMSFKSLWESINGQGSWNKNPWVWVVEFKVINNAR